METIGQFTAIQVLNRLNENLKLFLVQGSDGTEFDVLTIRQNDSYQILLERILRNEIMPLVNQKFAGIQQIVGVDFDTASNNHYIIYEREDGFTPIVDASIKNLRNLLEGLEKLKVQNRYGFVISNETLLVNQHETRLRFIGLYELFKHQNLLNKDFLAPEVLSGSRPNFQSDIYSVFECFRSLLENSQDEVLKEIFEKALSEQRTSRYAKYPEILRGLETVAITKEPVRRVHQSTIKVVVKPEARDSIQSVLNDMNNGCFLLIDKNTSDSKGEIMGRFSTKNNHGRLFVNREGYIFIATIFSGQHERTMSEGFVSPYGFDQYPDYQFDCYPYFLEQWEKVNTLSRLNNSKISQVKKWMTLPSMEREFVEEKAFRAKYLSRTPIKKNKVNIRFQLSEEFRSWELIKQLKSEKVPLSIDDQIIGEIQDYNPSDCFLVIKDCKVTVDEIPETGELYQDVRMETSQYRKQEEACKRFEKRDMVNPDLSSILATPETLPNTNRLDIDYDGFREMVINPNLKTDDTQRDAVLEALHHKPLFLIQGPPGTGKTTVIVELVQQLLKQNRNAKILVTSQSNLAVDNVLQRLPEDVLFMRLATSEDKIEDSIKEHSFQQKLGKWVEKTQQNSDRFLENLLSGKLKDKALINFHRYYTNINPKDKDAYRKFVNLLSLQPQYVKRLFDNAADIKQVEGIFNTALGKDFQRLKMIQKDWFAFLANVESGGTESETKSKSLINDGSSEIDLQTAFVKSVSVIGATCIHIASGQYKDIDFKFDHVIMDESSKASPAETLVPINMGRNIVLIGDHKQLPPVITRESVVKDKVKAELEDNGLDIEKEFGESLFEKLIVAFEENPNLNANIRMLDIQYRMPRQIGHLISKSFYKGALKNPDLSVLPNFDNDKNHGLRLKKPTVFIDSDFEKGQLEVPNSMVFVSTSNLPAPYDNDNKLARKNDTNRAVIKEILNQLNNLYANNASSESPLTVGVIAGYRGQVSALQDDIDRFAYKNFVRTDANGAKESLIEINTVDKFQGAERDIIIYDIVKSSMGKSSIGFLDDYRRINVAFSRVKRLLIVVGDSEYILKRATLNPRGKFKDFKLKEIVEEMIRQGLVVSSFREALQ